MMHLETRLIQAMHRRPTRPHLFNLTYFKQLAETYTLGHRSQYVGGGCLHQSSRQIQQVITVGLIVNILSLSTNKYD